MNSLRILVLNPKTSAQKNVVRDVLYGCWCAGKRIGGGTVPPFSLIQIATVLRNDGQEVEFLDAQAEQIPFERVRQRLEDASLLIASTSTMSFREDADYLLALKRALPQLKTVVFGSHPTFMPHYTLAHPGVDFIVRHEPEWAIRDLCRRLRAAERWQDLPGIGYRDDRGEPIINPPYPWIEDLDALPYPDLDFLPRDVHYFNPLIRRMPYMTATTSRGCPGRCIFCTAPAFDGKKMRFQSFDHVMGMLRYFASKGIREIYFRDDTFFVHRERDRAICRQIMKEKIDLTWLANARVNAIDEETMRLAREAGCHTIKFGIESGDQAILDGIKKGYRIEEAYSVFATAHRLGLNTHAHVMLGNPGDTHETIEKTIEFVKALKPTTATFGICTPYPGTPLFEELAKSHPEIRDGSASDLSKLHVEGLYNEFYCNLKKEELARLVPYAYRRFYLRPSVFWNFATSQIRGWEDIKRILLAGTRVLDFMFRGKT